MKKAYAIFAVVVVTGLLLGLALPVAAEDASSLVVQDPAICLDVVTRACVDANDVFPASVGKLFCFTKILGAQEPITITHAWYFGDIERARVDLTIRSANFRTFSSKRIQPHEIGNWRVDVLGPGDVVLKTITFEVVP
jgi:hypothetical protein